MKNLDQIKCSINVIKFTEAYNAFVSYDQVAITTYDDEKKVMKIVKKGVYDNNVIVVSQQQFDTIFAPLFKRIGDLNRQIKEFNEEGESDYANAT